MRFINFQKERVRNGEISCSTISNYYKAIKLFLEMNTDKSVVNWKKLAKGLPAVRKAANDRAPTIEELRKLAEYPDRRIRPIVFMMASSGIRLGAWDNLQWKHVSAFTNDNGGCTIIRSTIGNRTPFGGGDERGDVVADVGTFHVSFLFYNPAKGPNTCEAVPHLVATCTITQGVHARAMYQVGLAPPLPDDNGDVNSAGEGDNSGDAP
jgi:hypothetical protein